MNFYNKNGQIFEVSNTSELIANVNIKDAVENMFERDKLNKEKFLIRAKKFKNELNALLDKYGFSIEGYIDSNINDDSDIAAYLYIKDTEFTDSKRYKIEIMNFQDGNEIEYPELKVDSVVQESY